MRKRSRHVASLTRGESGYFFVDSLAAAEVAVAAMEVALLAVAAVALFIMERWY